jgi:hypothetical protein
LVRADETSRLRPITLGWITPTARTASVIASEMTGTSRITTWRAIRNGKLKGMTPEAVKPIKVHSQIDNSGWQANDQRPCDCVLMLWFPVIRLTQEQRSIIALMRTS